MASSTLILCDTNVLIEFLKGNPAIVAELRVIGQDRLAISVITKAELFYGALNKRELRFLKHHLDTLECLPIDTRVSEVFIQLMEAYALSHRLSIPDALIGATALVWNIELFTLNVKDFRFLPDIKLYPSSAFS